MQVRVLIIGGTVLGLCATLAGCRLWGRSRSWAEQKQVVTELGGLGRISLPLLNRPFLAPREDVNGERAEYPFERINETHINGTTSYRESLRVYVMPQDLDDVNFNRLLEQSRYRDRREPDGDVEWES